HEAARGIVERARLEGRAVSAEEEVAYARANAEVIELDERIALWREDALRRAEADRARAPVEHLVRPQVEYGGAGLSDDALKRFYENGFATRASGIFEVDFGAYELRAPGGVPRVEKRGIGGYVGAGTLGGMVP